MKPGFKRRLKKGAVVVAATIFISVLVFATFNFIFPLRPLPSWSTIVTDKDGNILYAFLSEDDKWRMKSDLQEIHPQLIKTILYKEDRFFYYHPGINPVALVRAAFNNTIKARKTSGASTITMQVARLLYPAPRTYANKFKEMFRAFQLELRYSKKEILEIYLNMVPYGGNVEGVKAASYFYFGVKPSDLNLSQSVLLSIIPNRPTSLHPGRGSALLTKERNKWLNQMLKDEIADKKQIEQALIEPLDIERRNAPRKAPHLAIRMQNVYSNRANIKTSLDQNLQSKAEAIAYNHHQRLAMKGIHNLAILIIENKTHKVRGYVGSPDFGDRNHAGQVDGCNAVRSPGSTLKPLVYAMAIDKGLITPSTILADVPMNFSGYAPENFNSKCNGLITASKALAFSLNIPAVDLLNRTGLFDFNEKLRKHGFSAIKKDSDMGLSVILGGCGVRQTELAAMYSAFANGGEYAQLQYLENSDSTATTQLVSDAAAFMVTEMLSQMIRPDLPNNAQSSIHLPKIAWKTGTSYGRRDAWSIGYNKKYTIAVWAGNFNGEGVPELTGSDIATPVLFELFNAVDYNSQSAANVAPRSTDFRLVCSQTGLPPSEFCTDLITDYYIPKVSDYRKCNHLREVYVSTDEQFSYCTQCLPDGGYKIKYCRNLPPAVTAFYLNSHIEFDAIPPHNPECTRLFSENAPSITSPSDGKEYLLEKGANQTLQLTCQTESDINWVYWYINDKFLKKTRPSEAAYFEPDEGSWKISCSDDKGRNKDIVITVKFY